jgi:hypothetical protein
MTDYELWKCWWYAVFFGASSEKRMQMLDEKRKEPKLPSSLMSSLGPT